MRVTAGFGAFVVGSVLLGCGGDSKRHGSGARPNDAGAQAAGSGASVAGMGGTSGKGGAGGAGGGAGVRVNERGTVDHGYVPPNPCGAAPAQSCSGEGVECRDVSVSGAVRTCSYFGFQPASCDPGRPGDECCSASDCDDAACLWRLPFETERTCGEPPSEGHNLCVANECESDDDCSNGLCTAASMFGVQRCLPAACRSDADCTERAGGVCRHISGGCCRMGEPGSGGCEVCREELPGAFRTQAVACVYPNDGCRYDEDCPAGSQCTIVGGVAACRLECRENDL